MNILFLTKLSACFIENVPSGPNEYLNKEPFFGSWDEAFRLAGHATFSNWEESFFLSPALKLKFPFLYRILSKAFRLTGFYKLDRFLFSNKIARLCSQKKIDLVFTEINAFISPKQLKQKLPGLICSEWIGVFPDSLPLDIQNIACEYDFLWAPCEFDETKVAFEGLHKFNYIGSCANEKQYYFDLDKDYAYDVVFVGGISGRHQNRIEILEEVASKFNSFAFYGYGCENLPSGSILKKKFRGRATPDIARKLYSSSKVALNLTLDGFDKARRGFNMRLFEIAACGGALQICKYDEKIQEFFNIGDDLEVFNSKTELVEKIEKCLGDKSRREQMVCKSFEKSRNFTYQTRAKKILDIITKSKKSA